MSHDYELAMAHEAGPMAVAELLNKRAAEAKRKTVQTVQATAEERPAPAEFWERPGILGAMNALDVWASVRWARRSGTGAAAPTMETIFEHPLAEVERQDERRGRVIEEIFARVSTMSPTAKPRLVEMGVELVFTRAGYSRAMRGLLMAIYPRVGPYTRPAYQTDLKDPVASIVRAYRPHEVKTLLGAELSPRMQSRVDSIWNQVHREMVTEVSRFEALPAVVFEQAILKITAPANAKSDDRTDALNRAFRKTLVNIPGLGSTEVLFPRASCDWPRKDRQVDEEDARDVT